MAKFPEYAAGIEIVKCKSFMPNVVIESRQHLWLKETVSRDFRPLVF
jgi:hypothetical protein